MARLHAVPLLLLALFAARSFGNVVLLHDSHGKHCHKPKAEASAIAPEALAGLVASLAGLLPAHKIDEATSKQIEEVVKPNVFQHPSAVVMLNLAGVGTDEEAVRQVREALRLAPGTTWQLTAAPALADADGAVAAAAPGAASLLQGIGDMAAANADVSVDVLDAAALPGCDERCLQAHLAAGLEGAAPASLSPSSVDQGAGDGPGALLGRELGALFGALRQSVERLALPGTREEGVHLYETTLVGLQALRGAGEEGGGALAEGRGALLRCLGSLRQQLDEAHGGDVVYQVALLGDVPVEGSRPADLDRWKSAMRRSLLSQSTLSEEASGLGAAEASVQFSNSAAAFGAALLLLWFAMGAIYCMCNMPFKQDTLLYGRSKAD